MSSISTNHSNTSKITTSIQNHQSDTQDELIHDTVLLSETVEALLVPIKKLSGAKKLSGKAKLKSKLTSKRQVKPLQPPDVNKIHLDTGLDADQINLSSDQQAHLSGVFVDATFGRGGHSRLLLERLNDDARLLVFDKDPEAISVANKLALTDKRLTVIHDSFANLSQQLAQHGIAQVNGIMADLGVSSPQLDDGSRGFSFMRDGAVDMRMDTTRGQSVAQWLKDVDVDTLADVLYEYGEERYSRRIARAIKQMDSYESTLELAEVIKQAHPNWQKGKHPATQSFQAMRIFINNELGDVDLFLQQCIEVLAPQANLAVISFHSLEDRRIKQFFTRHSKGQYPEDENLPIPPKRPKYFTKPQRIAPSQAEIDQNPRARSAWLRVASRTSVAYEHLLRD